MRRLADLREILNYVPQYREKLFVIALDGAVAEDANFRNLLLDIAVLRSLRIGVILVHGAGRQVQELAARLGRTPSTVDGTGVTDRETLELSRTAAHQVTHRLLEGLTATDLLGAAGNAVVAHPAGILQGVDHQFTGRVERIETVMLKALLANDIVPVVPPLGCDGEGQTYRLNSDQVAVEVATAVGAVKLVFLSLEEGIRVRRHGPDSPPELIRQLTVEEADRLLKEREGDVAAGALSKLRHAVRAARRGVPRVHVVDGRVEEGLLAEVFSHTGVGTLVYTNEYLAIRRAQRRDAHALHALIRVGIENDELLQRTLPEIEAQIDDFYIFEIDQTPAGCVALHQYPKEGKAEMACVCVHPRFENQRIGQRLMAYVEARAREQGVHTLFCLSTQAFNYFVQKGGFRVGSPDDLPAPRRDRYDRSGRRSMVLTKTL